MENHLLRIHVLAELRQSIGATASYELKDVRLSHEDLEVSGLDGMVTMVRTDRGLLVTVGADGVMREQCSRCLQPVLSPVKVRFTEEYVPVIDPETSAALRIDDYPDAFRISKGFFLDLTEGIRQYTLMSEPSKPLCSPSCKGLCPECGMDRNQASCSCTETRDPRWEQLAAIARKVEGR